MSSCSAILWQDCVYGRINAGNLRESPNGPHALFSLAPPQRCERNNTCVAEWSAVEKSLLTRNNRSLIPAFHHQQQTFDPSTLCVTRVALSAVHHGARSAPPRSPTSRRLETVPSREHRRHNYIRCPPFRSPFTLPLCALESQLPSREF